MPLSEDIRRLGANGVASLDAAFDYYGHDRGLWRLLRAAVLREGRTFTIRNRDTGTSVSELDLLRLTQGYVTDYLASATLQQFVSAFEAFVFDLLRLWLEAHPQSMGKKQVAVEDILGLPDKVAVIGFIAEREVDAVKYKRLSEWFKELDTLVKLGCPSPDDVEQLAEIKASRDVLVHNRGVVNATYLNKAQGRARFALGEKIDVPQAYLRHSWTLIRKVIGDVATAAAQKAQ
jgi:hypothetical protein